MMINEKMHVVPLITGSDGLLGREVSQLCSRLYPGTIESTIGFMDITDYDRVAMEFERLLPSVVINCAALTNVDWCEENSNETFLVNSHGARNVARACKYIGAKLIHISTDYVFDGTKKSPYTEDDVPLPLSIYGRSKLEGERAVLEEHTDCTVVRTSCLFGAGGKNFQSTVVSRCEKGERVHAFIDSCCSPTATFDLAQALHDIIKLDFSGILHVANAGVCTRFEFAQKALNIRGLSESCLVPVQMKNASLKAPRPAYSALDSTLFSSVVGRQMRSWSTALEDFIRSGSG